MDELVTKEIQKYRTERQVKGSKDLSKNNRWREISSISGNLEGMYSFISWTHFIWYHSQHMKTNNFLKAKAAIQSYSEKSYF